MQLVNVRLLALTLKRFFNTLKSKPVSVNQTIRIVHPYENLFRLSEYITADGHIDMGTAGRKPIVVIPPGEIWIIEYMQVSRTTGAVGEFVAFYNLLKGAVESRVVVNVNTAPIIRAWRGISYGQDYWFYPGDTLETYVGTGNAGDKGTGYLMRRVLRVGDDY